MPQNDQFDDIYEYLTEEADLITAYASDEVSNQHSTIDINFQVFRSEVAHLWDDFHAQQARQDEAFRDHVGRLDAFSDRNTPWLTEQTSRLGKMSATLIYRIRSELKEDI